MTIKNLIEKFQEYFKNNPEIFPVINSEVTVEAFKRQNSATAANITSADNSKLFNRKIR